MLIYDGIKHTDPVSLFPEMRNYTIFVEGIKIEVYLTQKRVCK